MDDRPSSYLNKKQIFTVGEISSIISEVLSSELFMDIKVRGEIISKQEKNGNVYLTLIDSDQKSGYSNKPKATLKVIVFSWYDRTITTSYKVGDEVVVGGDMSYYAPFNSLSLNAKNLYLYGEGMELIKLKRLKEKLEKEGIFDSSRKKPLPTSIRKIAIITSASGAAYHDIMETLSKKIPVSTVLFDALVQGADASRSLIRALDKAEKSDADLIIFGRGGGSKNDLSCFNDEALVRKLASCKKCVISGIGHEIDTSLCDLAADIYSITPTQAADKALPNLADVLLELSQLEKDLSKGFRSHLDGYQLLLARAGQTLENHSPSSYISALLIKSSSDDIRLRSAFISRIDNRINKLKDLYLRLDNSNPLNSLKEGTGIIKLKGLPLNSVKQVKPGDEIEIGLKDGVVNAIIK